MPKLTIGDRVAYAAKWLRSVGIYTKDVADMRGTVSSIDALGGRDFVRISWDDGNSGTALSCNLVLSSRIHLEAA